MLRDNIRLSAIGAKILLHRHLLGLMLFLVLVGTLAIYLSHGTRLSGDETFYYWQGKHWSRLALSWLQAAPLDLGEVGDRIVANGWFLPGMGILLAPLHLPPGSDPSVGLLRGYMIVLNLTVIFLVVRGLLKLGVPKGYGWLFLLLSCTIPYYLFFLGGLWGDLLTAHLAILVLIILERNLLSRDAQTGLEWRQALALGLMLGAIAMIRPQYVMLPGIVLARLGLHFLPAGSHRVMNGASPLGRLVKISGIVLLSFGLVLAPWHMALNKKFGATFMTTSVNLGPLFHDDGFSSAALAEFDTSGKFAAVQQKVTTSAMAAGRTFQEQVAIEKAGISAQASRTVAQRMRRSMTRFYLAENNFLAKFLGLQEDPGKYSVPLRDFLLSVNSFAWRFLLVMGITALILPANPRQDNHLAAVSLKGLLIMLSLQPLLTINPHGRYYVGLIPVCALLVALQLRDSPLATWRRYLTLSPRTTALLAIQAAAMVYVVANLLIFSRG